MTDAPPKDPVPHAFATRMSHVGRAGTRVLGFVNPPVHRGSTMLHPDVADRLAANQSRFDRRPAYGVRGNTTHHMLEDAIADIEGGTRCQILSSGLAAVTVALLAYVKSGDHILMVDSCYGSTRNFCNGMLARLGVQTTFYPPTIDAEGLATLFRPETTVLYLESPGSNTFEVQDVPALAALARARGAKVLLDNTWGLHIFEPFRHGVDASIQALTKYAGGHSDVVLGSITVNDNAEWERIRGASLALGQYASPDDCWLTLRGIRTLPVRLDRQMRSGLEVATWLATRPEVARVLHPALPGAPGHALWQRDFSGACSLFAVEFRPDITVEATHRLIDALTLFGIGASWGGFESLILPFNGHLSRPTGPGDVKGPLCRFHIGLEDPADLIADLVAGLDAMRA